MIKFRLVHVVLNASIRRFNTDHTSVLNVPKTGFPRDPRGSGHEQKYVQECGERYYKWQSARAGAELFVLSDGPPFANGDLHIGHALNKVLKDIALRVAVLQGKRVLFRPGWDCHGLPIELKASPGSQGDIRSQCAAFASAAVCRQRETMQEWGLLADYAHAYLTMDKEYEADQMAVFSRLAEQGLVYRALRPVHWSPSSRTALAEAELEYHDVESTGALIAFPVADSHDRLLTWTTTPWTVPANQAIAISTRLHYCRAADQHGRVFIVAKECLASLNTTHGLQLVPVGDVSGDSLLAMTYGAHGQPRPVLSASFVQATAGTGLVHVAPSYGQEDFDLCLHAGISPVSIIDDSGCFTVEDDRLAGLCAFSKEGESAVMEHLERQSSLIAIHKVRHRHPCDWRSKQPVIVRATHQWFIDIKQIAAQLHDAIDTVRFYPPSGRARMHHMVDSRAEWCISRQRTWGVPIPVFYKKSDASPLLCPTVVRHVSEMVRRHGTDCWWQMTERQLLPADGPYHPDDYRKGTETMDVWFDSGTAWSTLPPSHSAADVVIEGWDQFRGWFQSSLVTSVAGRGTVPYKAVVAHGFVLDERMKKMSKSVGNVVEPKRVVQEHGLDVMRLWVASSQHYDDVSYSPTAMKHLRQQYLKLRNTFRFILGNIHDLRDHSGAPSRPIDAMAIAVANRALHDALEHYNEFEFGKGLQRVHAVVVNDLSAFYFDVIKDRLYLSPPRSDGRLSAQRALWSIAVDLGRALAPITPLLVAEVSEHLGEDIAKLTVAPPGCLTAGGLEPLKELRRRVRAVAAPTPLSQLVVSIPASHLADHSHDTLKEVLQCADLQYGSGDRIAVSPSALLKCPRCWMHRSPSPDCLCKECCIVAAAEP